MKISLKRHQMLHVRIVKCHVNIKYKIVKSTFAVLKWCCIRRGTEGNTTSSGYMNERYTPFGVVLYNVKNEN